MISTAMLAGSKGRILRAGLENHGGSTAANREDYEIIAAELPEVIDLELDLDAGVLYWTDHGVGPMGNSLNRARIPAVELTRGTSRTVTVLEGATTGIALG